eukprot:m.18378 g.18378  ORF g.18378 m.18378 type:complete len:221 (-) comp6297_c0_seq2:20-682(-)
MTDRGKRPYLEYTMEVEESEDEDDDGWVLTLNEPKSNRKVAKKQTTSYKENVQKCKKSESMAIVPYINHRNLPLLVLRALLSGFSLVLDGITYTTGKFQLSAYNIYLPKYEKRDCMFLSSTMFFFVFCSFYIRLVCLGTVSTVTTSVVTGGLFGGVPGVVGGLVSASSTIAMNSAFNSARFGINAMTFAGSTVINLIQHSLTSGDGKVVRRVEYVDRKDL